MVCKKKVNETGNNHFIVTWVCLHNVLMQHTPKSTTTRVCAYWSTYWSVIPFECVGWEAAEEGGELHLLLAMKLDRT